MSSEQHLELSEKRRVCYSIQGSLRRRGGGWIYSLLYQAWYQEHKEAERCGSLTNDD